MFPRHFFCLSRYSLRQENKALHVKTERKDEPTELGNAGSRLMYKNINMTKYKWAKIHILSNFLRLTLH